MATTAALAWDGLTERAREIAADSARDAFFLGFGEGWQAQENRPFHCAYCGYECKGDTDAATIERARAHAGACEDHPLAAEIHGSASRSLGSLKDAATRAATPIRGFARRAGYSE